jgi:hypothetical protein
VIAGPGDVLTLQLEAAKDFATRCPELYHAVLVCSAFVNWRRIAPGQRRIIALSFYP